MRSQSAQLESRWPHRLAWLVVATTFPLIWVGGLVTTYEAGMAVPDWPNTYGYNLFLYPWQTWIFGPWDLFIEHGHRLLGAAVGVLTIGLALALWFGRPAGVPRWLGWVALAAVIAQGLLGGMRVLFDERQLAMIHACTGPAFFAFAVTILIATSRVWNRVSARLVHSSAAALQATAAMTAVLAYLQLMLGAQLRHVAASAAPGTFRTFVVFHLVAAALLLLLSASLVVRTWLQFRAERRLVRLATVVGLLIAAQIVLGCGAWLANYGWPWPSWTPQWIASRTIVAHGQFQTLITTGHVAVGSLIVVTSLALAMWSWRLVAIPAAAQVARCERPVTNGQRTRVDQVNDRAELVSLTAVLAGGAR